jgi:hypothetical protein
VTGERLLIGGQAEPAWTKRLAFIGPGVILAFAATISTVAVIGNLISGQFAAAGGMVLGAAIFGALFAGFLYNYLPRRAWLDGSVLTIEGTRDLRQFLSLNARPEGNVLPIDGTEDLRRCDLSSASVIRLHTAVPPMTMGGAALVLYARQQADSLPTRLLLRGPDLLPLPPEHLRMLAAAIESRPEPHDKKTSKVIRRLYALADEAESAKPAAVDWSFRTDPRGQRPFGSDRHS